MHYEQFQDGTVKCIEDEIPFGIPDSWEWCRFSSGFIINPRNSIQDNIEVSFIPMSLIQEGYTNDYKSEIRLWKKVKTGYTHFAENDIAIAKITPCFENKKSVVFRNLSNGYGAGTTELHIIRTLENTVLPEYVLWYIKRDTFISDGINAFSGAVGQKRISKEFIEKYLIPLPPVSEQKRVIEAIHTAFISIDNIEYSNTKLNVLINIAKSKILDLAIRGKLVPQDPNDEPASLLLERIKAEKEELIKQGKIKRDKKESVIFKGEDNSYYEKIGNDVTCIDDEIPFDIPPTWNWCRLGTIGDWAAGATPNRKNSEYFIGNIPWLKTGDLNDNYITYIPEHISEKALQHSSLRLNPTGSVLIAMYGATIGKLGILTFPATTNQACCACLPFDGIDNKYLFYYLMSQKSNFIYRGVGGAQSNISKEKIISTLFPLPPKEEQHMILSQIEKLMKLIQQFEELL